MLEEHRGGQAMRELANDLLLIARIFTGAIAGFIILTGIFVPWEVNAIISGALILLGIGISTLVSVGIMILLIMSWGKLFLRLWSK